MIIHLHCLALLFDPEQFRGWIEWGGYSMLFGLLVACGMGLPLPEDIPLFVTGMMVAQHRMHPAAAAIVAWLGIMAGDTVLYSLGWRFGKDVLKIRFVGRHVTPERFHRTEKLFAQYGIVVVAVARMVAGIRAAMVVTAGATKYNYFKFIVADAFSAIISGGLFLGLGIWCGHHARSWRQMFPQFELWFYLCGVVALILLICYIWVRSRAAAHKAAQRAALEEEKAVSEPQYK